MSATRHHAEWLSLVEVSGPFLTMPVLERVFPQGLDAHDPEHVRNLRVAFDEWESNQTGHRPSPAIHKAWIDYVLMQTLGLTKEVIAEDQGIPQTLKATIAEHGETLRPQVLIRNPKDGASPEKPRLLLQFYPYDQDLEKPVVGRHWKASPATRMMELLHQLQVNPDNTVCLGLITNGEHWMLVYAPKGNTTGFASWYATLWFEERLTLQAFRSLLGIHRFFAVADDETLEEMFKESANYQNEVTDQLGLQVRHAVEVLIQSLDRADQDDKVLADVPETVLYEAALTVMMRLVFLFSAEERGLLLLGDPLFDQHYAVSTLVAQLQEAADQHGEEVLERRFDAWVRLLSTFRAVFGGVQHERMKLPAYAGNLFNPDRFPFLEGRKAGTSWHVTPANPLPVNNRTVLHLLRSLQYLEMQGESRRLSFRALDIEQIGHVYEGLLDHTAKRATEPMLGLLGAKGNEPEVALSELERLHKKGEADLLKFLNEETGRQEKSLKRGIEAPFQGDDAKQLKAVCGTDEKLFARVRPFSGLLRNDTFDRPVVIRQKSVFVTAGTDRRSSGTHYTPRSLTEPIVQYTLEPLVYVGPAEGKPKDEWKLRSAKEILDLKICDMACGSAAFLVQTCRYLSELIVEAWEDAEATHPGIPGITPDGAASTGAPGEVLIPKDANERLVYARRIVAQRCLYGVDKNPLAVEMAKLSLWLFTLAKDKPFTFLDHAIRCGDSLVGIQDLEQIKNFNLDPTQGRGLFTGPIFKLVDEAVELRKKIQGIPANTAAEVEGQAKLLADAEEKTARLRYAADLLLSVEFQPVNPKERESLHNSMAIQAGHYVAKETVEDFREIARKALNGQPTFHWPLEFPEAILDRAGFDGFVGNPPFMGGKRICLFLGDSYHDFLKTIWSHSKGAADLCTFFLLRAGSAIRNAGAMGFVTTNSIAQGDTREMGLDFLTARDFQITNAIKDMPWPGGAGVRVSRVNLYRGDWKGERLLDDMQVDTISAHLEPYQHSGTPNQIRIPTELASYGTGILGIGFTLDVELAKQWIMEDDEYKRILFPYINASELNNCPDFSPPRWVINFHDWDEEEAAHFTKAIARVRELVKPQRDRLTRQIHEHCYWKHWDRREELYRALSSLRETLVVPLVTTHLSFAFLPTGWVFSKELGVLPTDRKDVFCYYQSTFHDLWARRNSSTLKAHLAYSFSDALRTYVVPDRIFKQIDNRLCDIGKSYNHHRCDVMLKRQEGLTKTYNRFHDSEETAADIQTLREMHVEMDKAIAATYGWDDLRLGHDFHPTKQGVRFTISEAARNEVLGRLLQLNHERYAEEVTQGLHEKGGGKGGKSRGKKNQRVDTDATPLLDGLNERESDSVSPPSPINVQPTDEIMAAFRQATRGRGSLEREELLKAVSVILGYKRLGPKIEEALRGHLRAAIRRKIIEADGTQVRAGTTTMADYALDDLREIFVSVMHKRTNYERDEVMRAIAHYLGFARLTDTSHDALKSAINSAIRHGVLGYEGSVVWREQ